MNDLKLKLILEAVDKASPELKKIDGGMGRINKSASAAGVAMRAFGAAITAGAIVRLGKNVLEAGMAWDRLENAMLSVTGTAKNAAIELAFVTEESKRLGLDLVTAGRGFTQLAAAAKGTSVSGQQVRDIFTAVGEASVVLGLSAADSAGAIRAISQVMSKGTVQAEELRGQLGERIPGAFQIAARAMGKTTAELNKMLEMGQLLSDDFLPKFAAQMHKEFGSTVPEATRKLQAELNRLGTSWFELKGTFADAGAMDAAVTTVKELSSAVERLGTAVKVFKDMQFGDTTFWEWLTTGSTELAKQIAESSEIEKAIARATKDLQGEESKLAVLERELYQAQGAASGNQGRANAIKQDIIETRRSIDYLKEGIAGFETLIVRQKELRSAAEHTTFKPTKNESARSTSGTEIPYLETTPYVPPTESQWEITAREKIAAANKALAVQLEALHEKQAQNRKTYAGDIAAGEAMGSDVWVDFNNGLAEAQERTQVSSIQLSNDWTSALKNSLDDLADYYDDTFSDRISGSVFDAFATMEDTLVEFVNTGKASFKDLVNSILDDMLRMTIQQSISSPLASALSNGLSGLFGTSPSGASNLFGGEIYSGATAGELSTFFANANGNAFSNGRILPFATGTIVTKPTYFPMADGNTGLMGEAGEEGILPLKRINGKLGVLASGGGGPNHQTIVIEQHFDLRNYNGENQLIDQLRRAAEEGAERGYQKVGEDFHRRGPLRRILGG